jgi:hypothetical protein
MGPHQQWAQGDTAFFAADSPYTCFRDPSRGLATSPDDLSRRKFGSMHPGVTQFVLLDGGRHGAALALHDRRRW